MIAVGQVYKFMFISIYKKVIALALITKKYKKYKKIHLKKKSRTSETVICTFSYQRFEEKNAPIFRPPRQTKKSNSIGVISCPE